MITAGAWLKYRRPKLLYGESSDPTQNQICYAPNDHVSNEHNQKGYVSQKCQNEKYRNQHYRYDAYDSFFVADLLGCVFGFGHNGHYASNAEALKKDFKAKWNIAVKGCGNAWLLL